MCHVKVIQKTDDLQDLDEDEYCKYLHDTMSCYHKCYCDGVTCRPKHDEGVAILGKNKECKPLGSGSAARLPASAFSGPPSPSLQAPSQVWFSSRPPSPSSPRTSGHGGRPTCPLASCQNPVVCEVQLRDPLPGSKQHGGSRWRRQRSRTLELSTSPIARSNMQ